MDSLHRLRDEVKEVTDKIAQLESKQNVTMWIWMKEELRELIEKVETLQKKICIVDMIMKESYDVNEVCDMIIDL